MREGGVIPNISSGHNCSKLYNKMMVIILLILGLGRESLQLDYNTYSFKKATFWVDKYNNYRSTGLKVLTYN